MQSIFITIIVITSFFPRKAMIQWVFTVCKGWLVQCQTLNLEDLGTVHILASYLWLDQSGRKPMALLWSQSSHTGLRIMQAWPPQQGDKLWVLRLKRQSILRESYYLPPQNTTNKVLKPLKLNDCDWEARGSSARKVYESISHQAPHKASVIGKIKNSDSYLK